MILCCGEALIDMIPKETGSGETGFVPHSGGAIFNTAIALGRLGVPVGFLSGLSNDLFGVQLVRDLESSTVDASFSIRSDLPTTLAFVALKNGHATYTFYDENSAGRSLDPADVPELPEDITALYFGGISLISEPGAEFYAALAEREAGRRTIMLDPNIRPGFIRDETGYRARLARMIAASDIVKVSDEDLAWLTGQAGAVEAQAQTVLAQGPGIVIVTKGKSGAAAYSVGDQEISVPAKVVEVVDTVGAGDTFNAGVLASLFASGALKRDRIEETLPETLRSALAMGAEVAAVTVSRAGANPPWAKELKIA